MKILIILSTLLLSTSVFASKKNYEIKMNFSIEGKPDSVMSIRAKEGQKLSVQRGNKKDATFLDLIATEGEIKGNKGILMKFNVGLFQKDGSKKIIATPTILAKAGKEALITVAQEGSPKMDLKVVVIRK